jgi:dTDP-4-dehydrorhamnose reductase
MILLLGASGYIGQAFASELRRRNEPFTPVSRRLLDYTKFDVLFHYVRKHKPAFLINAAGFTGKPDVAACELARKEALAGNAILPHTIGRVCLMTATPWAHVSSGSIFCGARLSTGQSTRIERHLTQPWLLDLFESQPERFYGFSELDEPNFSFHSPPCTFFSGTKALGEEAARSLGPCYIWRLRLPFDEYDHPRNFLTQVQRSVKTQNNLNSLSHRGDFVSAGLDLWKQRAPMGTYNITNPGAISTRQIVEEMHRVFGSTRYLEFGENGHDNHGQESVNDSNKSALPNCILDTTRLLSAGVKMRAIQEAIADALERWQPTAETLRMLAGLTEHKEATEELVLR